MHFANPLKRDRQVVSTKGHVVEFPGKQPGGELTFVSVPAAVVAECVAAGLVPGDDVVEAPVATGPQRPKLPEAFKADLYGAFDALVAAGERESFSGSGMPKADAVSRVLGWKIEPHEITANWAEYQASTREAAEEAAKEAANLAALQARAAKEQKESDAANAKAEKEAAEAVAAKAAADAAAAKHKGK